MPEPPKEYSSQGRIFPRRNILRFWFSSNNTAISPQNEIIPHPHHPGMSLSTCSNALPAAKLHCKALLCSFCSGWSPLPCQRPPLKAKWFGEASKQLSKSLLSITWTFGRLLEGSLRQGFREAALTGMQALSSPLEQEYSGAGFAQIPIFPIASALFCHIQTFVSPLSHPKCILLWHSHCLSQGQHNTLRRGLVSSSRVATWARQFPPGFPLLHAPSCVEVMCYGCAKIILSLLPALAHTQQ